MPDLLVTREEFLASGHTQRAVRPVVLDSWRRCRDYGLNPHNMRAQTPDSARLERARIDCRVLLQAAEPLLGLAHAGLSRQPHLIALSDKNACVLRLWLDPSTQEAATAGGNLFEGASWDERDTGCNGIGTCLQVGHPVLLIGPEHFQEEYVGWTCIGVPIHHPDGSLAGAIDLSVPNPHVQPHTWGWILSVASTIENALACGIDEQSPIQLPPELSHPLNTTRGVLDLLAAQLHLAPTHSRFVELARRELDEAARQFSVTMNALAQTQQRLEAALEVAQLGVWEYELAAGSLSCDYRCRQILDLGQAGRITREEILARLHPEDRLRIQNEVRRVLASRGTGLYRTECRIVLSDGNPRWLALRGHGVRTQPGDGELGKLAGTVMDITQRKRLEEDRLQLLEAERAARAEFERAVRLKDEFLATVSHELRSPLSAIGGWARLLGKGTVEPEKASEIICRSVAVLEDLVDDLLDMCKILSGRIRIQPQPTDLVKLVTDAVEAIWSTAQAKRIQVDTSFSPGLEPLTCDARRIRQVITNLLGNAVKFTPDDGHVSVSVEQSPQNVTMVVSDNGKGIHPEFLPHLFERFSQQDGGLARKHSGLGLGLSISHHLIQLHGGTIRAQSDGDGKGATFTVVLPRSGCEMPEPSPDRAGTRDVQLKAVALNERTLAGVNAIHVDDDFYSRELVLRVLADAGARVRTAASVRDALRLLDDEKPDVLLCDLSMPDVDGQTFVRQLKTSGGWRASLPAIALTALGRAEDRERALSAGFDAHISKPFEAGALIMRVLELTHRSMPDKRGLHV